MARAKPQPLACPCCKTGKPGEPSTHVSFGTWYEIGPSLATWPNAEKYSPFSTKTWLCGSGASASVVQVSVAALPRHDLTLAEWVDLVAQGAHSSWRTPTRVKGY